MGYSSQRRYIRTLLVGFLPLLFLLASCSGGGGGGGGGGQGLLSVELAFTPGNENVTVELMGKGPLVQLLNISSYQLTAIDSANETIRIEGERLAEGDFNGSVLRRLTNDRNYTFALRVFYFPVGSAELSNLSLRIDYAEEANARNERDAGGITIGINTDGDYLADLVDGDDDNDNVTDGEDTGEYNGRLCRLFVDCDGDSIEDGKDLGEVNGVKCYLSPDCDNDTILDNMDSGEFMGVKCYLSSDCDNDTVADGEDSGEYDGRECRLFADCDNDTVLDAEDLGEFNGVPCRAKRDCDEDTIADVEDNCPMIASSDRADGDGDGAGDSCDLDADGDGLIEIGTAAELDAVRWALDGSGRRLSEEGSLDQTGCGNGADRTACGGYELTRDISLAAYADGEGWAPLGQDMDSGRSGCQGPAFSGVFEGNGFTVRELNINRGNEDCIGLFGHLAEGTVIRNLMVRAGAVIGRAVVGGLVGNGGERKLVEIVSSSSVAGEVRGSSFVGGLVGFGQRAKIVSSSSVVGKVSGGNNVGGLVSFGDDAKIVSSSSVVGKVSGGNNVGGLAGSGNDAKIVSSSSIVGEVSGRGGNVGGLVGDGTGFSVEIVSSFSVVGKVSGGDNVGGLVGVGSDFDSSYWHTAIAVAGNDAGEEKTLAELRTPTNDNAYDMGSIYANWTRGADINNDMAGVEDITIYCDEDLSGAIETDEMRDGSGSGDDNRIWDFGGTNDYPAIRCLPLSLVEQRSWWFINSTGHPNVNRTRLDALISP